MTENHPTSGAPSATRSRVTVPWRELGPRVLTRLGRPWFFFSDPVRRVEVVAIGPASAQEQGQRPAREERLTREGGAEDERLAPQMVGALGYRGAAGPEWPRQPLFAPELCFWTHGGVRGGEATPEAGDLLEALPRLAHDAEASPAQRAEGAWAPLESREAFEARVARATAHIREGLLEKVVVARSAALDAPPGQAFDVAATLESLLARHASSMVFAVGDGERCFLGATPETLVSVRGGQLETHAVAGTAARAADSDEDAALGRALLASAKDRAEQEVVARAIAGRLAPYVEGLEVGRVQLLRLPGVQHLVSPVRARLREGISALELARALHPTPAVGGYPADVAEAWLTAHEPLDRGLYAGPVGFVDHAGDGVFAVAIRSALVTPERAVAFAGAGVVDGSVPENEWRETELKLATIRSAIHLSARAPER